MIKPIRSRPGIEDITPYVYRSHTLSRAEEISLASNENPFGPSPLVIEKIKELAPQVHLYPEGSSAKLREAIGKHHHIDPNQIICTAGSEDGLNLLIRSFSGPGDEVLFSQYAFQFYDIAAKAAGATVVRASAPAYHLDIESFLSCVSDKTKIVLIDNPSNPIGHYLTVDEITRIRQALPDHVLLVLDSAYAEYMEKPDYSAGIDLVNQYQNVVMTRTFSKFYGLAGLRLGWIYGPSYIQDLMNRARAPFCCNALAQEAGIAALKDLDHQKQVLAHHYKILPWFMNKLNHWGLKFIPSVTNFILVEFPSSGSMTADCAYAYLAEKGFIVRPVKGYGLMNHLRISLGLQKDMERLVEVLDSFLQQKVLRYGIN